MTSYKESEYKSQYQELMVRGKICKNSLKFSGKMIGKKESDEIN